MARLIDIANAANVSVGLVSRVLSNDKTLTIRQEKRNQIIDIATEMGYRKKFSTKGNKIAIFNWYNIDQEIIDPYFYYIRNSVSTKLKNEHIDYNIYFADDNISFLGDIDGIIAIGKFDETTIQFFKSMTNNIVFIDSDPYPNKYVSYVVDFDSITTEIMQYFYDNNHRKIGFVGGEEFLKDGTKVIDKRMSSYINFTKNHNIYDENLIKIGTFTTESGYSIGKKIGAQKEIPTAIFCANDQIAFGLIRGLHECNIKVPNDVAIFGFNNIPFSNYSVPSLSTVELNLKEIGEEAVKTVIDNILNDSITPKKVTLPYELIFRETTIH